MQCGLLGRKLSHSYSPQIHSAFGTYDYQLFEVEPEDLNMFFASRSFQGINVTIPYKKSVISYCDNLTPQAERLGAVNTIVRNSDGTLLGHNTDYYGFLSMLKRTALTVADKKVLVLGSGGAGATIYCVLQDLGANPILISRSGDNHYGNLHRHKDAAVIVNATPVGMYPNNGQSPIDLTLFPQLEGVLDVIYNPSRTQLLMDAQRMGIKTENGLHMLVAQAKESSEWFTGHSLNEGVIDSIRNQLQHQMENIVLVGMPGSGKSTVGKLLAQKVGKRFVDADEEIIKYAGCTIPVIFATQKEDGFRKIETHVLSELGRQSGLVIATGGGCVTRQENYSALHQNGKIVWLKRDIRQLATDGRPLSQSGSLEAMYKAREPLYRRFSDISVTNEHTPMDTADAITALLQQEDAK